MTTAGSPLTKAADSYRAVQDSITELHNTGTFSNHYGNQCSVSVEQHVTSPTDHEYNVRTESRTIVRNGGSVKVVTEQTVETFYSFKTAAREYNWQLYVLQAPNAEALKLQL